MCPSALVVAEVYSRCRSSAASECSCACGGRGRCRHPPPSLTHRCCSGCGSTTTAGSGRCCSSNGRRGHPHRHNHRCFTSPYCCRRGSQSPCQCRPTTAATAGSGRRCGGRRGCGQRVARGLGRGQQRDTAALRCRAVREEEVVARPPVRPPNRGGVKQGSRLHKQTTRGVALRSMVECVVCGEGASSRAVACKSAQS